MKTHPLATLALALALLPCASSPCAAAGATDAYNLGVEAFRAHDYVGAQAQWQKSAAAGDADAMSNLGFLLSRGLGSPPDEIGAVALWLAAADAGSTEAQAHLGRAARDGRGLPRDPAAAWARLRCAVAAAQRHPDDETERAVGTDAALDLAEVAGTLTSNEVARGQSLADACIASLVP